MKQILVYADSLSWGIVPGTRQRLAFDARSPGVMENAMRRRAVAARVFENCLNGRRTAWNDPFQPGRNGILGIEQVIEMHSPLDLVIVMLGTNDFQTVDNTVRHSADGIGALIESIRRAPVEPGMPVPPRVDRRAAGYQDSRWPRHAQVPRQRRPVHRLGRSVRRYRTIPRLHDVRRRDGNDDERPRRDPPRRRSACGAWQRHCGHRPSCVPTSAERRIFARRRRGYWARR